MNFIQIVLHFISNMISFICNCLPRPTVVGDIGQSLLNYFNHPGQNEDFEVPLSPLLFENYQLVDSKTKYNEDHSIVTRICEDYQCVFVNLKNTLTSNEFILIQILKVDHQLVGGLKLFLQLNSNGCPDMLYADSKSELDGYIIFWMSERGNLFCGKGGRMKFLYKIDPNKAKDYKLFCEMYGPVQQIRAFVGRLNTEDEKTITEVGDDTATSCAEESDENLGDAACSKNLNEASVNESSVRSSYVVPSSDGSNSQRASPEKPKANGVFLSMKIHCKDWVEITVKNLPKTLHSASNSSAICSGSNGTSNDAVETCHICMDENADTVLIPCGHLVCCYECASRVSTRCGSLCPICRTEIKTCHKVYSRNAECKKCEMDPANVVLLPCGDMCLCDTCSTGVEKCPICQWFVNDSQKVI